MANAGGICSLSVLIPKLIPVQKVTDPQGWLKQFPAMKAVRQ
jgi:hypothetical protein